MKNEAWVFTFGCGMLLKGKAIKIHGSYGEARDKMMSQFGKKWAFQYSAKEWDEWKKDPKRAYVMEDIICEID